MSEFRLGVCVRLFVTTGVVALSCIGLAACGEGQLDAPDLVATGVARQALAPENTLPPSQTTNEDTRLTFVVGDNGLSVSDPDNTQTQVQITVTNGNFTAPPEPDVTITGNGTPDVILTGAIVDVNKALNGSFFQPSVNYSGSAQLQMNSQDTNGEIDQDILPINVTAFNDPPVIALPPGTQTGTEDTPKAISITVSDVDVGTAGVEVSLTSTNGTLMTLPVTDGLTFTAGANANVTSMTFQGALPDVNSALNGLTVTPEPNYVGTSSVNITVDDLGNTGAGDPGVDNETLDISWSAVNDAPKNTVPAGQQIDEDTSFTFSTGNGTALSVTDIDAPTTLLQVTLSATGGLLTLGSTSDVTFVTGDGTADTSFAFTGTLSQLNAALEGTVFAATANFAGTAKVTLTTNDLGNSGAGGAKQDTDSVDITVVGINDAPVNTVPGAQLASEDVALTFGEANRVSVADVDAATVEMAFDVTGGTVTLSGTNGLVFQSGDGTADAAMTFTGTLANVNAALSNMRFLSDANYHGDAIISMEVSDLGASGVGGVLKDSDVISITVAPVNDPPTATNDTVHVEEDAAATLIAVLANDTIAPDQGETLALSSVVAPAFGTAVIQGDAVLYTPAADFNGVDTFTYVLSDGSLTDTATVTVEVQAVNDPPTATDDSFTVKQATATTLGVLSNDSSAPDGTETLTVSQVTAPTNGTVLINADSLSVRYTSFAGYEGPDSFTYTVSDGVLTATAEVTLTVTQVNTQPVNSLPAPQTTSEDIALFFTNGDGNAIVVADENNATLTVSILVANGTFSLGNTAGLSSINGNGTTSVTAQGPIADLNSALEGASYSPAPDFNGSATLTITTSDSNGESDEDSLTLTVAAINDPPTSSVPTDVQAAVEDTPKTFSDLSVSDIDVGAGQVRVSLSANNGTTVTLANTTALTFEAGDGVTDAAVAFTGLPANVNAALNGLTVTPPRNFIGSSTLTLTTNDLGNVGAGGAKEDVDVVQISWAAANDAPQNLLPPPQTTDEDLPLSFSEDTSNAVRIRDDDAGGAPVKVTLSITNGTLSLGTTDGLDFTKGDGTDDVEMIFTGSLAQLNGTVDAAGALEGLVFVPSPEFTGTATLTLSTDDQGNTGGLARTDTDDLVITVGAVNDPPVNQMPSAQATAEDTALIFATATGNPIAIADIDASSLQVSLSATSGTLSLAAVTGLVFQAGDGDDDDTMTFRGAISAVNAALNGLRFEPAQDVHGVASLTLRSDDLGGTGLGGPAIDEDTLEILVSPVNDEPTLGSDAYTVEEDAAPTVLAVLLNDTSLPDGGETLTIVSLTTPTRGGTVSTDGQTVTYQPLADFFGTERFDYTVFDGGRTAEARVTITVTSINDAPSAVNDTFTLPRNATNYLVPVLDNDVDPDAVTLTITATTTPAHGTLTVDVTGTEVRYTAASGYSGTDTFEYTIEDELGLSDTAAVTLTIDAGLNSVPVAVADLVTLSEDSAGRVVNVLSNDEGLNDTPVIVTVVSGPTHGTAEVQGDNTVLYVPAPEYSGVDAFQYSVTDADGESSTADVNLTVSPVDDTPVASADTVTTAEDTVVSIAVLDNDRGLGDGSLVVTILTPSAYGAAVVEDDNTVTFEPAADYFGQTIIVYSVTDGEQSSTAAVTIVVTPVADAPDAVADAAATRPGAAVDIDVLANDSDADHDTLVVSAVSEPANGTASMVDGKVRYVPADGFEGTDELEYTIDDGTGLTDVGVIVVAVGVDGDGDGLIDLDELDVGTDPTVVDTDGDLIPDGLEVHTTGTDPLDDDSDDDGLLDGNEDVDQNGLVDGGETDPNAFDTDGDRVSDGVELGLTQPQGDDTDQDVFVADADPSTTTDPTNADTDGDGINDGEEDKNRNGRSDPGELNPNTDDAPSAEEPSDEDEGGCSAVTADGALAWFGLLAFLWRVARRRELGGGKRLA